MSRTRYLLVLARLESERGRKLGVIASASQLELALVEDTNAALLWLERHEPEVVAFDSSIPKAEKLCQKLRGRKAWGRVPVIALAEEPGDAHIEKLFAMGVDDVVPLSAWPAFISRVRALPRVESIHPPPARGKSIVADPERERCDVVGRVLVNAGFDVRYALDHRALEYYSLQTDVALIVMNVELGDPREYVERARKNGSTAAWVIASRRRDLEEHVRALAGLERVASVPALGDPESVLFVANGLLSDSRTARYSSRVLYGTRVAFRSVGADTDELGFSYNVSADGLYVRTLALPEGGEVWLELCPPRQTRRVRLLARVVWRRDFEDGSGASVPPGFAVELSDGLGDGLASWREGYRALDGAAPAEPPRPVSQRSPPLDTAVESAAKTPPRPDAVQPGITALAPRLASHAGVQAAGEEEAPEIEIGPPVSVTSEMDEQVESAAAVSGAEPATTPSGTSRRARVLVALLFVVAVLALLVLWQRGVSGRHGAGTAPIVTPAGAVATPGTDHVPAIASAPAPTRAAPSAPTPPPEPSADLKALLATEGYLYVRAPLTAKVFISGVAVGPTNQALKVRCGLKFVRVGNDGGHWLTDGRTVKVGCRKLTKAEFAPATADK